MRLKAIPPADSDRRAAVLSVACSRCERAGRYNIATLIETYGVRCSVPDMLRSLSAACPKRSAQGSIYDQCGAYCPDLPALFQVPPQAG
jgi:hypothetical protein